MPGIDWNALLKDADMSNFPNHISIQGDNYDPLDHSPEYLEYRRQWVERPRTRQAGDFPLHLDVEATNRCNLRCKMCFVDFGVDKGRFIDFGLFCKVVDEGARYGLKSIKFNYRGEPTLHPRLVEMAAYAKSRDVMETQFNTNATLLTEDLARRLIEAGLDKIIVSIDGVRPETYNDIRVGADYETVVANVRGFVGLRDALGSRGPFLRVQMVCMRENREDIPAYIALWKPVADQIGLLRYRAIDTTGDVAANTRVSPHARFAKPCHQLFQRLIVGSDGMVTMCCGDSRRMLVLGDAAITPIRDIWNGKILAGIRRLHAQGHHAQVLPCQGCEIHLHDKGREWEWLFGEGYHCPEAAAILPLAGDAALE